MKYIVEYEVEAPDMNSASRWAHELLFKADEDVVSVKVRAAEEPKTGKAFADGGRVTGVYAGRPGYPNYIQAYPTVMPSIPTELSPRVYDHVVNGEDG